MSGCFGNSFWDRSMQAQLFDHLSDLDAAEEESVKASELARILMEKGKPCDRYTYQNFGEALRELSDDTLKKVSALFRVANSSGTGEDALVAFASLNAAVDDYWYGIAYFEAEKGLKP